MSKFDEREAAKKASESVVRRKIEIRTSIGRIPLCGCGSSERMWEIVRDALQRSQDITDTWDREREAERASVFPCPLVRVTGFYDPMGSLPADAVEFVAHVLHHHDFLEHGSSVQCAWLTAPGKLVLLFLRKYGVDSEKWPEWATTSTHPKKHGLTDDEWRSLMSAYRDSITESDIP